ncbi:MAG TPA: hypothetical protein DCO79_15825 [Spirochaeta sp.]|nr:hypothetical protein [Spirochaeta sp.]
MDEVQLSIGDCLFKAMEDFSEKIHTIVTRDPNDTGELACLYSGISGIETCMKGLASHGHLPPTDTQRLEEEIKLLYSLCAPT